MSHTTLPAASNATVLPRSGELAREPGPLRETPKPREGRGDGVPPPSAAVSPLSRLSPASGLPFLSEAQVAEAEKSVDQVAKVRRLALRVTGRQDWQDISGRPYLNHSGCMKVAALFGLSLTGTEVKEVRERFGEHEIVRYVAKTTARFLGREVESEGVASSDESFFARRNGKALPLSEIDLNAVRKKAVTNAQCRAVKMILGLGGITWEDVHAAGVRREELAAVEYGRRRPAATGASSPPPAARPAASAPAGRGGRESLARARLRRMAHDLALFEDVPFERVLRRYTSFEGQDGETRFATSIEAMSDDWVKRTLGRVERDWRAVPPKAPAATPAAEAAVAVAAGAAAGNGGLEGEEACA